MGASTLPVTLGGLGLRSVGLHAPGAYVTSQGSFSKIMEEVLGQSRKEVKVEGLVYLINTLSGQEFTEESALASLHPEGYQPHHRPPHCQASPR